MFQGGKISQILQEFITRFTGRVIRSIDEN